jgi:chromosome segregation ATPase
MASPEVLSALEQLHKELEKLEPAIKHVETAQLVTETVKTIPQKHIELIKEVKDDDKKHKLELKELFTKELLSLTEEGKRLSKTTEEIQKQIKIELEAITSLKDQVRLYHEKVDKINFPERLDKLDANVAGLMAAIQSIHTRLDNLERNIADRLKDAFDYQKETRSALQTSIDQTKTSLQASTESNARKQQTYTYVTWVLIALVIAGVVLAIIK